MHVPHRHARFIRRGQLRPRNTRRDQRSGRKADNRKKFLHERSLSFKVVNQHGFLTRTSVHRLVGNATIHPSASFLDSTTELSHSAIPCPPNPSAMLRRAFGRLLYSARSLP